MNPGVFLDPNLNDILVFVDTEGGDRESLRIPNIPLDIPFRIGIILNDRVLEFYLNCRLETTKILKYKPKKVDNVMSCGQMCVVLNPMRKLLQGSSALPKQHG